MNFAKGILEARIQTYHHLRKLLKPIAIETPTAVELSPGNEIRVTLFDANHCIGSVMFLIEGNGNAILYTGDIRSEPWWINSLVQNPVLLPYATGLKCLDNIYLDTTFASNLFLYREFPSKKSGIEELLSKVLKYPPHTCFHVQSWTFGYESVWVALSSFLKSQIHLDRYRWELYKSLATIKEGPGCKEASQLYGYNLGNHFQPGCLTTDHRATIHSCERGGGCPVVDGNEECVQIIPIVTRLPDGSEVREMGIGGGYGDIDQVKELEMQDTVALQSLVNLCKATIGDRKTLAKVIELLVSSHRSRDGRMRLSTHSIDSIIDDGEMTMKLEQLVGTLVEIANAKQEEPVDSQETTCSTATVAAAQPDIITFPYSRHSSYSEICSFIEAFKPVDVYPCTVNERNWTPRDSMQSLFGHLCSGSVFKHDEEMMRTYVPQESQQTESTYGTQITESDSLTQSEPGSEIQAEVPPTQERNSMRILGAQDKDTGIRSSPRGISPESLNSPRKRLRGSQDLIDSKSLPRCQSIPEWGYDATLE
jgi:DNA cross-link repair 1C protein